MVKDRERREVIHKKEPLGLIDSHCHLEEIENPGTAIERAKSAGVVAIIAVVAVRRPESFRDSEGG